MSNLLRSSRYGVADAQRLLVTLTVHLSILLLATGCGGSPMAPAMMDSPAAPGGMAQPAPPAAAQPQPMPPSDGMPASAGMASKESMYADMPRPAAQRPAPAPAGAPNPGKSAAPSKAPTPTKAPTPAKAPPPAKPGDKAPAQAQAQPGPAVPVAPLLIYVGDLQMQVLEEKEIPASIDKVIDVAESLGGYLAGRKDTSVQVRIPSAYFREGFTRIEQIAEVLHRSVTADDVSEQYSDLEVRLVNLRATHKRLQEFLSKAGNIQDMLTVGRELERVAGEIEAIEGKMRFLRSRAAFSLVSVSFTVKPKAPVVIAQKEPPPPPPPPIRELTLPIRWLPKVGLDNLLNLN